MLRYIDDENGLSEAFPPDVRLVRDKLIIKEDKVLEDTLVPSDASVATIIKQIADKVCPFIQVTVDCPSFHSSGYMPLLDIALKVVDNRVTHRFYRKEMVNFFCCPQIVLCQQR